MSEPVDRSDPAPLGRSHRSADTTAADMIVGLADRFYQQGEWSSALPLYRNAATMDPTGAADRALPLAIGHCSIELAAPGELDGLVLERAAPAETERERIIISRLRFRARRLCQAGDVVRASRLLRLLASYDRAIGETYRYSIDSGPTPNLLGAAGSEPPFLAAAGLSEARVEAMRRRAAGRRMLLVYRRFFYDVPGRENASIDLAIRTAARFGFEVRHLNSVLPDDGPARAAFPAQLRAAIAEFRPDIIVYEELFESDPSAKDAAIAEETVAALAAARRTFGTAVVNCFYDAWQVPRERLFKGLGACVDLIVHFHPGALGSGSSTENAAVFCYMTPLELPAPTVAVGTVPRACFVGAVYDLNISRLVWWAEIARRGVRLDFLETDHGGPNQRTSQEYVDLLGAYQLSVNFTRRWTGVHIITGRTLEVPLAGGVLLEEASADSAYFLQPDAHYVPFLSLDDLAARIDALLDDPARRADLAAAGHRWAMKYFTGDYFWAGVTQLLRA